MNRTLLLLSNNTACHRRLSATFPLSRRLQCSSETAAARPIQIRNHSLSLLLVRTQAYSSSSSCLFVKSSRRTNSGLLTPEEKRAIFLRKSQQLQQAIGGVLSEKNAAIETVTRATAAVQQNQSTTTTTTTNAKDTSPPINVKQAFLNVGVSFLTLLLAAQAFKMGALKKKADLQLEAALEVLEEKRVLLRKVQDATELQTLAQQCIALMEEESKNKNTSRKSTGSSSLGWYGRLLGSSSSDLSVFDQSNDNAGKLSLEDKIVSTLSNHVHQLLGDAAMTDDEKDRNQFQRIVHETTTPTQQQQNAVGGTPEKNDMDQLLNALVNEQQQEINSNSDGTNKRQLFQI